MTVYKTIIDPHVASAAVTMSQSFPAGGAALVTQAVTTVAADVYAIVIDNSLNTSASYLKCWDSVGAAAIGTTHPLHDPQVRRCDEGPVQLRQGGSIRYWD